MRAVVCFPGGRRRTRGGAAGRRRARDGRREPRARPGCRRRSYQLHRARRRARVEHKRRTKRAGARFWVVFVLLVAAFVLSVDHVARDRSAVRPLGGETSAGLRVTAAVLAVLIAVAVPGVLVVNALRVLSTDRFVRWELGRDGFPPDRYGLSTERREASRSPACARSSPAPRASRSSSGPRSRTAHRRSTGGS